MPDCFLTTRRVEFHDTDAAGIVHFSSFFLYMEQAEHALLRSLGWSVVTHSDAGVISWPRVAASCQYHRAAKFEDVLKIEVTIAKLGNTSATYRFRFLGQHERDELLLAEGEITSVCCRLEAGQRPQPVAIPPDLRTLLERFTAPSDSAEP